MLAKKAFLKRLTSQNNQFKSIEIGKDFEGSSPPSVFIGKANYPNIQAGPMLSAEQDSMIYDVPESWLGRFQKQDIKKSDRADSDFRMLRNACSGEEGIKLSISDIINFRLNLVRGKSAVNVHDIQNRFVGKMQDIALSDKSVYAHAQFSKIPRGFLFSEDNQPFGPSATLSSFEAENSRWQKDMEKAYYDTDLLSKNAVLGLHGKGLGFTAIQKALSVGAFGKAKNRKLVPTRWSITATDDMLGKNAMQDVKQNEVIENYRVYESEGMHNHFSIMMTPTKWQYEATEAFINIMDNGTFKFGDHERFEGRKKYSEMGGCYYAQRFAISDFLKHRQEQAGAFVFREVYEGYVPTGVWICRELTKSALQNQPKEFKTMQEALQYIHSKTQLGIKALSKDMPLLQQNKRTLAYWF
jgi:hypothetical protein